MGTSVHTPVSLSGTEEAEKTLVALSDTDELLEPDPCSRMRDEESCREDPRCTAYYEVLVTQAKNSVADSSTGSTEVKHSGTSKAFKICGPNHHYDAEISSSPTRVSADRDKYLEVYHTNNDVGELWVIDRPAKDPLERCLLFEKPPTTTIQSCMPIGKYAQDKRKPFAYVEMMLSTLFFVQNPKRILVIGMGGATLQKSLRKMMPDLLIDTVEINPEVIHVVTTYFGYQETEKDRMIVDDGTKFVSRCPGDFYDLVLIDAFTKDYIPPSMLTNEFMRDVRRIVKKDGVVAINTWMQRGYLPVEERLIMDNFASFYLLRGEKKTVNSVFVASRSPLPARDQLLEAAVDLEELLGIVGVDAASAAAAYDEVPRQGMDFLSAVQSALATLVEARLKTVMNDARVSR